MEVVVPGNRIGDATEHTAGKGTYVLGQYIYASVVGVKRVRSLDESKKSTVEVVHDKPPSLVPQTGDVVTCKITKISSRLATADILIVGTSLLQEALSGTIRPRDCRAFDVDSVEVYKCFRPGDIVRAHVLSLGDSRSYYLTTAKNELGVILAQSAAGHTMIPISWDKMQCPKTKAIEFRKVAKISQEAKS